MSMNRQELITLIEQGKRFLESQKRLGIEWIGFRWDAAAGKSKAEILEPIRFKALACRACTLAKERRSVVWGEGSLDAPVVFVGEGPGRDEDEQGRPFVGRAGELLNKMIKAMGFQREQVYIANIVKCRPPMNRVPEPDEVAACHPFLEAQLTVIQPKVICALGRTAANNLLGIDAPMGMLRGRVFEWRGIPMVATFHPAYLLRNPSAKTDAWKDLQKVMNILGMKK
ncbi:MAG: uracil-DNA glycosylase [Candidatus Omnitrophica bacterium]|nr:uracil-DNA glycosylase [Candidatus Omnitrophota bacterium]